jgi:hypothetical protein
MIAFLLAAALLLVSGRPVPGIVFIFVAALVKAPALLALPPALVWLLRSGRNHRQRELLVGLLCGVLVTVACYLPFWEGTNTLEALRGEGGYFTASLGTVLHRALTRASEDATATLLTNVALRGAFLAIFAALLLRLRGSGEAFLQCCAWTFFVYLALGAFWFMPWYAIWPLAFASATADRGTVMPALVLSITAMLSHAVFGFGASSLGMSASSGRIEVLATALIWSLPLAAALWTARKRLIVTPAVPAATAGL